MTKLQLLKIPPYIYLSTWFDTLFIIYQIEATINVIISFSYPGSCPRIMKYDKRKNYFYGKKIGESTFTPLL